MRKSFFLRRLAIISLFLMALSCSSEDSAIDASVKIKAITETAASGTWHITSFIDSGNNETNNFNGYDFVFNANGTVTATKGAIVITGTWSITEDNDNSNDDNSNSDDIDFNIAFATPPDFEELTEDWDIISTSASKIDLIHVSGGNGGTDTLTFEK